MLATAITKATNTLSTHLPFISGIESEAQYHEALEVMDELVEDYENNLILIEALSNLIARYEDNCDSLFDFNRRQDDIDPSIATLRVLMHEHKLSLSDFENEIGKKSLVSQILSGKRNLTRDHIQRLSNRFNISPALFF